MCKVVGVFNFISTVYRPFDISGDFSKSNIGCLNVQLRAIKVSSCAQSHKTFHLFILSPGTAFMAVEGEVKLTFVS